MVAKVADPDDKRPLLLHRAGRRRRFDGGGCRVSLGGKAAPARRGEHERVQSFLERF